MADYQTFYISHFHPKQDFLYTHLKTSTSTRDTQSKRRTIPNMGVITLGQQLHNPRHCSVVPEEYETKSGDSSPSYIVIDIRDSDMEKLLDGLVVTGTSKGEGDGEHTTISEDGILDISSVLGKG